MNFKDIEFSFDLVKAAIDHLEFLSEINSQKEIFDGDIIDKAIFRYEKLWLPFLALNSNASSLAPPLDVAWIWHCHLLAPQSYSKDLEEIIGVFLEHQLFSKEQREEKRKLYTQQLWNLHTNASFDFLNEKSVNKRDFINFRSKISYDLKLASKRQFEFFYNVSLPHFRNPIYLKLALERYKKFLRMKQAYPELLVVPCYAIDLIWHTHQLNPRLYRLDTTTILGKLFPHDDTINDRKPGGILDVAGQLTKEKWKEMYQEEFFMPGAMYRGPMPHMKDYSMNKSIDYGLISSWFIEYVFRKAKLTGDYDVKETNASFSIFLNSNSEFLQTFETYLN